MECTELPIKSSSSPILSFSTPTPFLSPSFPLAPTFHVTPTSFTNYPSSSSSLSTTSATLLGKIKSLKPSYNQRRNTSQISICKKSGCNNRLIIDDGKSMGYCSMMCQLNDWSQPSQPPQQPQQPQPPQLPQLSQPPQLPQPPQPPQLPQPPQQPSQPSNPTCGDGNVLVGENRLNSGVNNRLCGNGLTARSGSGINFNLLTNFGSTRVNKRQPTQQKRARIKSWSYLTRQTKSVINSLISPSTTTTTNDFATAPLNSNPLALNSFSNTCDLPSSESFSSNQLGILECSPFPCDLTNYNSNLVIMDNENSQHVGLGCGNNNNLIEISNYPDSVNNNNNDYCNNCGDYNLSGYNENDLYLNNNGIGENSIYYYQEPPSQQLSFNHASELILCPACTFLNDSRSNMCEFCFTQLSPQVFPSYTNENDNNFYNYNAQFSQPLSQPLSLPLSFPSLPPLPSQPQVQLQPMYNFSVPPAPPSISVPEATTTSISVNLLNSEDKPKLTKTQLIVLPSCHTEFIQIQKYFLSGLPHARIHSIIKLQMPTKLIDAHEKYKKTLIPYNLQMKNNATNNLISNAESNLDNFTNRRFHGTKISCNPQRFINGQSNYCIFNCGMCGIIQNGNQGKYSRFNGRMWFANNSAISLGYCGLSTSRTIINCTPFSSKNSLLAMFVVDVVSVSSSDIIIVDKDAATLPKYLILFETGF